MLHLADVIQPKLNERVEAVFRRHRLTLVLPLLLAGVLITLPWFWLFSFMRLGAWGVAILGLPIVTGLVIGLRAVLLWDANAFIITNERVVHVSQGGIFHRMVQEIALHAIYELACESRGIFETCFGIGTLRVRAGGAAKELIVGQLATPERARAAIERLRGTPPPRPQVQLDVRAEVSTLVEHASATALETVKTLLEKHDT